jgi:hypothetical protein
MSKSPDNADMRRRRLRVRRDKYKGWTVSLDGCDHPARRARMMYAAYRPRWSRRVALAVAAHVVGGSERARRYLVRAGWEPGAR